MIPSGEFAGWPLQMGIYHLDQQTLVPADQLPLKRALNGEHLHDIRLYLKNAVLPNGRIISCSGGPIRDSEGGVTGAAIFFKDITLILHQEEFLKKERSFFSHVLNSIPAFVFSKDLSGSITFKNQKCHELDSVPLQFLQDGLTEEERRLLETLEPFEKEESFFDKGTKRYFRIQNMPMFGFNGLPVGISGIAFETTEAVQQKNLLDQEQARLASSSKLAALGMLAAELSHEINNPLAIIRTSSWILHRMLSAEVIPAKQALEKLREIDETVQRISDIITSVKNLSRDSSKEIMSEVPISELIKDVQSICAPKFKAKSIELRLNFPPTILEKKISCLRVQLSEVFINLLVNAVDAIEDLDEKRRWISIEIIPNQRNMVFRICDGGEGVPPDLGSKIFTPFFSTKDVGRGTGIGLSISLEIMKKHGGSLTWNPKVSPSCFDISLPL